MYKMLKIGRLNGPTEHFTKPQIVGHYSINDAREYCNDLSQLKYYKKPLNPENVNFNLDDNEDTIVTPEDENTKLDDLLRWMSENFDQLKRQNFDNENDRWLEPEIVCCRGLLKAVMATPYNKKDGWIICASKFKGTIYLCAFDTIEKKQYKLRLFGFQKKCTLWGRKFEHYMLSGTPSTNPDLSVPFNQNEIFCCVFKSKLRETVLLYAGEIDGIRSQQQIQDTLVGKDVELIELKTASFKAFNSYGCIKARKTLRWWCQSYLAGIQNIVCGLRNDNGIVTKIREYKLKQLVSEAKFSWNDGVCRNFCDKFLQQVKTIVTKDCKECLYKFTYEPGSDSIIVDEIKPNPNLEYTFLYSWYIAKAKQYFEKR